MRRSFSSHEQYNVADAQISETEVNGNGGAHAPVLLIPVRIDFHIHPSNPRSGIRFGPLRGQIELAHRPFAVAPPVNVNLLLRADYAAMSDQLYYLEFSLDAARIAFLEKVRAGGDLKLKINLTLTVEKLFALHDGPIPHDAIWGSVNRLDVTWHDEITVPRSSWVSRVLPQIGYGTIHLIELPAIPLAAVENFKAAFESLTQAQEHHKHGLYDEAVAKCRVALEHFFERHEVTGSDKLTRLVPKLKSSWETKLGKVTYDWLNGSLAAIKGATNPTHHAPGPHYDQLEAQVLIAVTIAVVAYAAKHDLPADMK
jgi:hypothetical protein